MTIFIKEGSSPPPVPGISFPGVEGIVPRCRTNGSRKMLAANGIYQ